MNNETLKRDLCARLPYRIKVDANNETCVELQGLRSWSVDFAVFSGWTDVNQPKHTVIKPYLFPTSALTKPIQIASYNNGEPFVPKYELEKILGVYRCDYLMDNLDLIISKNKIPQEKVHFELIDFVKAIDFLNKIHINYRLSADQFIEVTDEFNPYL